MEAKQLIESGSLELYVMGSLPAEEMKQIDELRKTSKEVNDEIHRIESALEEFAFAQSLHPKAELKDEIAARIGFGVELDLDMDNIKTIIVHLRPVMRFAAAAGVVLILGLSVTTVYFVNRYNSTNNELLSLKSEQSVLANQVKHITSESEQLKNEIAVVSNPAHQHILLNGLPISPTSKAIVFWNKEEGNTFINASALPQIAANEQFQLWAIVDGKPVDLGVINKDTSFAEMKQVKNAVAFAITLEPLGGKSVPTMEKMYVLGNV
ncbi:MAG: anti-sigma factor [Bacteroidota bacterium]